MEYVSYLYMSSYQFNVQIIYLIFTYYTQLQVGKILQNCGIESQLIIHVIG